MGSEALSEVEKKSTSVFAVPGEVLEWAWERLERYGTGFSQGGRVQTGAHPRALSEPAGILEEMSSSKKGHFLKFCRRLFVTGSALSSL